MGRRLLNAIKEENPLMLPRWRDLLHICAKAKERQLDQ